MTRNPLHYDTCFINSIRSDCQCSCSLTEAGKSQKALQENEKLKKQIKALYDVFVKDAGTGTVFVNAMNAD